MLPEGMQNWIQDEKDSEAHVPGGKQVAPVDPNKLKKTGIDKAFGG